MKFEELLADHAVRAVRMKQWVSQEDYLELPPVIDGRRGPWCYLVGFNGREMTRTPMLWFQCDVRDGADWLKHDLPADYTPPNYPSADDVARRERSASSRGAPTE